MLSLYKGKENDTLLKAYHYYKKKIIESTVKVWKVKKKEREEERKEGKKRGRKK